MQKTALITGGGSGLGQALAWELAKQNIQVFIIGRHTTALTTTQTKFPDLIHCIKADIATEADRHSIINQLSDLKTLNYLIHSAGVIEPICPIKELPLEKFDYAMSTNFLGPLFLTQQLLPKMTGARVLHISTILAHQPMRHLAAYCISKAALYMSKELLNVELNAENIL